MKKSIQKSQTNSTVPAIQPLSEFEPNIYTVATWTNEDVDRLRSMIEAIGVVAEFENTDERHILARKLMLVKRVADISKYLADDAHNVNDCRIATCMLASEDPEVRKAARP